MRIISILIPGINERIGVKLRRLHLHRIDINVNKELDIRILA